MSYQIASGFNNETNFFDFDTALSTDHIKPPICQGIQYLEVVTAADGTVIAKGSPYVVWEWGGGGDILEKEEYDEILGYNGLTWAPDDITGEVTIRTLYDRSAPEWRDYNAIVVHQKVLDYFFQNQAFRSVRFLYKIQENT